MPLIRYDIGDYAMVGAPCSCGRTLPVLERVMGRVRNMLILPNGEKRWPLGDLVKLREMTGVRQYQYVQKSWDRIEVRMVVDDDYDRAQELALATIIRGKFGYPFQLDFVYVDTIGHNAGGKFEDFVSELPAG
jgi:phenylacetate-CoA ligase